MSVRREPSSPMARRPLSAIYLLCGAAFLLVLNLLGGVLPHSEATWGVAHSQRLTPMAHIACAIGTTVAAVLAAAAALRLPATSALSRGLRAPWAWVVLLALLAILIPNTVPYGDAVRFYRFVPGATAPEPNAPLSFEVHRALARLFPTHLVAAFSALSWLAGILTVPAFFRLARALFPAPDDRLRRDLFLLGMAGSAVWQLFLGYVEHYHLQLAFVLWGLAFLLEGRPSLGGAFVGLAAAWNLSAAWLLPAIALAFPARAFAASLIPIALSLALLAALYGPGAVIAAYTSGFHPLATANAGFFPLSEIFAPRHLLFVANEALLVAPLAAVLAPALLIASLRDRGRWRGNPSTDGRGGRRRALILVASLAFALLWNPRLGFSRDWDLFAWPLCVAQVFALEAALRVEPAAPRLRVWLPILAAAQGLALLYLLSNSRFGH